MNILVVSKYAPVPSYGSNPRWFELGRHLVRKGHEITIITSDSNHGSTFRLSTSKLKKFIIDGVRFTVIRTLKYGSSVSPLRVVSWFDF